MSEVLRPLTLDLLACLAAGPRPYAEIMEAWRTACPRLTIWEDAVDAGLVTHLVTPGQPAMVGLTPAGARYLGLYKR